MRFSFFALVLITVPIVRASDLTATRPAPNSEAEPLAGTFSMESAVRFLDQASLEWTQSRECFTCHTNYVYLMARPATSPQAPVHLSIRRSLEELVEKRWPEKGPRWDAEVVMSAATLALNDRATSNTLHPTTRKALDRMWRLQREDGGFDWLKCGWPPMESDDDYGAAMALLAVYSAPDDYARSRHVQEPLRKLYEFIGRSEPPTLHHVAMLLWADSYGAHARTSDQRDSAIERLLGLQQANGGWAIATLGNWERADGSPQDTESSDGYGTGFVIYVLRRAGVTASDARLQRGLAWLRANQRSSGRWFTRSLNKDSKHFISHAGTAFATLALAASEP